VWLKIAILIKLKNYPCNTIIDNQILFFELKGFLKKLAYLSFKTNHNSQVFLIQVQAYCNKKIIVLLDLHNICLKNLQSKFFIEFEILYFSLFKY
jgi:hypothetical protein